MITFKQTIGAVQEALDYPIYDSLSDARVFWLLLQEGDYLNNQLDMTGKPWNYSSFQVTINPQEQIHPITEVGDFMNPFLVVTAPTNPFQVPRSIRIKDPAALFQDDYAGLQVLTNTGQSAAFAVAFMDMPGQPGVRACQFAPAAGEASPYTIYYQSNVVRPGSILDPLIKYPQWEAWLFLRAVVAGAKYSEWLGMTPEQNRDKAARLLGDLNTPGTFAFKYKELDEQFTIMRRRDKPNRQMKMRGFGRIMRSN